MKRWQGAHKWAAGILAVLICVLTLGFLVENSRFTLKSTAPTRRTQNKLTDEMRTGRAEFFLSSILSLVQNYYVDAKRVATRELAMTALGALDLDHNVSYDTTSEGVTLQVKDATYYLPLTEKPTYEEFLAFLQTLANIGEKHKIFLKSANGFDRDAPKEAPLIDALLKTLDAHSSLLSPVAYRDLRQGTEGSFGGLGVLVGIRDQVLTVVKPIQGSPAQRAGIRKNDRILAINNVFTFGRTLESLVDHMRGDPGSLVHLSILRRGAKAPAEMRLFREIVQVESVYSREVTIEDVTFLHLTIENFASRTSREVRTAIQRFRNGHHGKLPGLIVDLRSNPGGLLDQAVQVADIFLNSGIIVSTKGRHEEVETAMTEKDEMGFPMVVLIDDDSASASEIVAGALQDQGRAIILGQPSYGKGSVQTIFELPDERALKLTIARYFTPAGRSIQNVGIYPDIWLQPVYKKEKNVNLLGDLRYRNESFLRHHLEVSASESDQWLHGSLKKAYYLTKENSKEDDSIRGTPEDQELSLAIKLLQKTYRTYGLRLPLGAARASHWLGLSGPQLSFEMNTMDEAVSNWMRERHHVNWTSAKEPLKNPHLNLSIDDSTSQEALVGSTLALKWKIQNQEDRTVHRLSLFIRSEQADFEPREVLLGSLNPGQTLRGQTLIPIAPSLAEQSTLLSVGIALDAKPLSEVRAEHLVQVRRRPLALLDAKVFFSEEKGGKIAGVLEPHEKAKLRLHIENQGLATASDLKLSIVNLSGTQLSIRNVPSLPFQIEPQKSVDFSLDLAADGRPNSTEFSLGIYVDGENLQEPLRHRTIIKSLPIRNVSIEKTPIVGH